METHDHRALPIDPPHHGTCRTQKSTHHPPRVSTAQPTIMRWTGVNCRTSFAYFSIIAIRLRQQPPTLSIRRAESPRDRPDCSTAQSFKSLDQVARLVDHIGRMIASLARIGSSKTCLCRNINCWTAAITKKHRPVYERTYPTTLVFSDGSSIEIQYHEPRKIIVLPLNLAELTEAEQKKRLEMRKPKTKIVIAEEIEDSFDENRYLNLNK